MNKLKNAVKCVQIMMKNCSVRLTWPLIKGSDQWHTRPALLYSWRRKYCLLGDFVQTVFIYMFVFYKSKKTIKKTV